MYTNNKKMTIKTLTHGATTIVQDDNKVVIKGDSDLFVCICKAFNKEEGWMKSTKAMEIEGVGCVVQVTTQQGDNVAEAVTFVPGVEIKIDDNGHRRLVKS